MKPIGLYRLVRNEIFQVLKPLVPLTGFSIRFATRFSFYVPIGIRIYVRHVEGLRIPERLFNLPVEVRELAEAEWSEPHEPPRPVLTVPPARTHPPMAAGERVVCFKTTRRPTQGMITGYLNGNGKRWLLTANHVVANNGAFLPFGPTEGIYGGFSPRIVSRSVAFEPIPDQGVGIGTCDAAVCELDPATELATQLYPAHWRMTNGRPVVPAEGQTIHFLGFGGVEKTARVIDAQHNEVGFNIGLANTNTVTLKDHILVEGDPPLAPRGDSGSLAVLPTADGMRPVGIVVLGPNPTTAVICPLANVFEAPGIKSAAGELNCIMV